MATFEPYRLDIGPYQEGNKADWEIEMEANFPMSGTTVTFQARSTDNRLLISKRSADGGIAIDGRKITVLLDPADTVRKSGKHNYELDFINSDGDPFATIYGVMDIRKQINS